MTTKRIISKVCYLKVRDVFVHQGCRCKVIGKGNGFIYCCLLSNPEIRRQFKQDCEQKAVLIIDISIGETVHERPITEIDLNEYFLLLSEEPNPEPVICSHFGCGRTLGQREQMFGRRCIHHSIAKPTRTL